MPKITNTHKTIIVPELPKSRIEFMVAISKEIGKGPKKWDENYLLLLITEFGELYDPKKANDYAQMAIAKEEGTLSFETYDNVTFRAIVPA